MCVLLPLLLWQTIPGIVIMIFWGVLVRLLQVPPRHLAIAGTVGFLIILVTVAAIYPSLQFVDFISAAWWQNLHFYKLCMQGDFLAAMIYTTQNSILYLVVLPLPFIGIFACIDMLPDPAYRKQLKALERGISRKREYNHKRLDKALDALSDDMQGIILGISKESGKPCILPDSNVNQMVLVLGTTGSGKTITLRRFYQRAFTANYPLIIVDGKPTAENTAWIAEQAKKNDKPFYSFNCEEYWHYDPLAYGGYTEMKDKIISLKDEWESDYYRSIAEDYLQTTFEILQATGESYDLKRVAECLDFGELALIVRNLNNPKLAARAKRIGEYERKDITGLQAHLNLLVHSELGAYFEPKENHTFNLGDAIQNNAVVYFALPALRFPSFSKVLGKLIINDIKSVSDHHISNTPIFTVFDEFSVFAGDQVLNLINMGRGKGLHAVFGTQGIADLKRVDPEFSNQVLNCVNTLLCHRLNDHESAEAVASWAGTKDALNLTAQISAEGSTGLGSVRRDREFVIHPDAIKQDLQPGEAFYISKIRQFHWDKIKVKLS